MSGQLIMCGSIVFICVSMQFENALYLNCNMRSCVIDGFQLLHAAGTLNRGLARTAMNMASLIEVDRSFPAAAINDAIQSDTTSGIF